MKKTAILGICLVVCITMAAGVFALATFREKSGEIWGYELTLNQWNLVPTFDSGLTVIDESVMPSRYENENGGTIDPKAQMIRQGKDIKFAYVFDSVDRKYIPLALFWNDTPEARTVDKSASRYPVMWLYLEEKNSDGTLAQGTRYLWVKEDMNRMASISDFTLKEGWNFIWSTPDMQGKPLSEWQGTCTITRIAGWDPESGWQTGGPEMLSVVGIQGTGLPLAIKLADSCTLKMPEAVMTPPSLPE
jgi:hypothetical protein